MTWLRPSSRQEIPPGNRWPIKAARLTDGGVRPNRNVATRTCSATEAAGDDVDLEQGAARSLRCGLGIGELYRAENGELPLRRAGMNTPTTEFHRRASSPRPQAGAGHLHRTHRQCGRTASLRDACLQAAASTTAALSRVGPGEERCRRAPSRRRRDPPERRKRRPPRWREVRSEGLGRRRQVPRSTGRARRSEHNRRRPLAQPVHKRPQTGSRDRVEMGEPVADAQQGRTLARGRATRGRPVAGRGRTDRRGGRRGRRPAGWSRVGDRAAPVDR